MSVCRTVHTVTQTVILPREWTTLFSRLASLAATCVPPPRLVRALNTNEQRSGAARTAWTTAETLVVPNMPSGGHTHASLGRRAKEEAALGGRPEDTRCIVRVVVARDHTRVFLHVASHRAICLRLAR